MSARVDFSFEPTEIFRVRLVCIANFEVVSIILNWLKMTPVSDFVVSRIMAMAMKGQS